MATRRLTEEEQARRVAARGRGFTERSSQILGRTYQPGTPISTPGAAPTPGATPTPGAPATPMAAPTPGAKATPRAAPTPGAMATPGASPTPQAAPTPGAPATPGAIPTRQGGSGTQPVLPAVPTAQQQAAIRSAAVPANQMNVDNTGQQKSAARLIAEGANPDILYQQGQLSLEDWKKVTGHRMTKEAAERAREEFLAQGQREIQQEQAGRDQEVARQRDRQDRIQQMQDAEEVRRGGLIQREIDEHDQNMARIDQMEDSGNFDQEDIEEFRRQEMMRFARVEERAKQRTPEEREPTAQEQFEKSIVTLPDGTKGTFVRGEFKPLPSSQQEDPAAVQRQQQQEVARERFVTNFVNKAIQDMMAPDEMTGAPGEVTEEGIREAADRAVMAWQATQSAIQRAEQATTAQTTAGPMTRGSDQPDQQGVVEPPPAAPQGAVPPPQPALRPDASAAIAVSERLNNVASRIQAQGYELDPAFREQVQAEISKYNDALENGNKTILSARLRILQRTNEQLMTLERSINQ